MTREELIALGSDQSGAAMLDQSEVTAALMREYQEPLFRYGLTETIVGQFSQAQTDTRKLMGNRSIAGATSKLATRNLTGFVADLKSLSRRVRLAAPMALAGLTGSEVTPESFDGGKLGRSVPRMLAYIEQIRPFLEKTEERFKPYFAGESPLAMLETIRVALASAEGKQELAKSAKPENTEALSEAKGRLLDAILTVNRIGRIAFDGQATIAAKFNRDILLNARRKGRGKKSEQAAPTTEVTGTDLVPE
jgi:hypothetical protein